MNSILKKTITVGLIAVSLCVSSGVALAKNIDNVGNLTYSKSKYPANFILEQVLKSHQSMLSDQKSDRTLTYKRYLDGTMTAADKNILKSCNGNSQCLSGMVSAWKWTYKQRDYNISLYTAFVQAFQNKLDVSKGTATQVSFIKSKYGQSSYDWIIKNKSALDTAFDNYIAKERNAIATDKFSAIMDESEMSVTVDTYEQYVRYIGWSKLESAKKKSKTNLSKAAYEYYQYRLLSDERLYLTN